MTYRQIYFSVPLSAVISNFGLHKDPSSIQGIKNIKKDASALLTPLLNLL